jgi:putative transposase
MKVLFIQAHARIFHIATMCRVLKVSRAGFNAWRPRPLCERVPADRRLTERIRDIQQEVTGRYGSRRVRMERRALGFGGELGAPVIVGTMPWSKASSQR